MMRSCRRIPYVKIDKTDPTEEQFRSLMKVMIKKMGFEYRQNRSIISSTSITKRRIVRSVIASLAIF